MIEMWAEAINLIIWYAGIIRVQNYIGYFQIHTHAISEINWFEICKAELSRKTNFW